MPDLTRLTQTELLAIVNGTPLAGVLTRSRLRRQLDLAGSHIFSAGPAGEAGKGIDFLRYARWLLQENGRRESAAAAEAKNPSAQTYQAKRDRTADAGRAKTRAAQDCGPIPDTIDWARREAAAASLRTWCETYFREAFYRPWAPAHLKAIDILERVIIEGGLFAYAMPRDSGKTTLARAAAAWAIFTGRRRFIVLIGASQARGIKLLAPIRMAILENKPLGADWPEAVHPFRALENSAKRQAQQTVAGKLTHVKWGDEEIVFPTVHPEDLPPSFAAHGIAASPSSGGIIAITSLDSNIRGPQHALPDGSLIRPSLAIADDPQTRRSARSPIQTKERLDLLMADVLGMGDSSSTMACMVPCTKIYENDLTDQLLDGDKHPEWQGECSRLVVKFPNKSGDQLWDRYRELRLDCLRRRVGLGPLTSFYRQHAAQLEAGSEVPWPECYDHNTEASPLQYAMNLKLRDEEHFLAEYQNDPRRAEESGRELLTPQELAEKVNGRPRGGPPLSAVYLSGFVDVHDQLLYWCVCAWEENFSGYVLDYGTFPDQAESWFTESNCRRKLRDVYPKAGRQGAILAGLEACVGSLLAREWPRPDGGGTLKIDPLLVDIGYEPGIVQAVKHKAGAAMMLARGEGIGAGKYPMSHLRRKPGERHGHHWYTPSVRGTAEFPHVTSDTNYWKSEVHRAFSTPLGGPGSLSLFGKRPQAHELFAEHVAGSEYWVATYGHGRACREWKQRPGRDNHWFDCVVGCAVGASMKGAKAAGEVEGTPRRQAPVRMSALVGRRSGR